tara:strand:+ start:4652 stop:5185 length:534 start_codon:yes stop_codon:yes gene_type:complete
MCDPTVMIAMQIAGAAMSYMAADQQAKEQTRRNNAIATEADRSYKEQVKMIDRRMDEEKLASVQAEQDVMVDARNKKATAIASAGESGVAGISIDSILHEVDYQEGTVLNRNLTSTKNTIAKLNDDKTQAYSQMAGRYNSLSSVQQPSFLGTALEVGSSLSTELKFDSNGDLAFRNA